jgi:hypothetical protein|nr:MAG TPA: hypothetical protein [Caudoviricetes sp.]DAX87284.1 MAG TPA: hypothetical protein [Caudoviricetes sp.]
MMEDNLKELVRIQRQKYRIISRAEEIQNVINSIKLRHNCSISVRNYSFPQGTVDENVAIGHCDNDCIDEDDVCKDIIEALNLVRDKYIKAFEELDAEVRA